MGPADRGGEGAPPPSLWRAGGGGGRGEQGLRVLAGLRFRFHVENKSHELKAFLLVIHGES